MMSVRERYAYFIVHRMLRLEEGEHLTLNVDEDCLDEAHTLAHEAANTSQVAVTMVTIRQGRVDGVDEIEPDGGRSLKARREVLLHLAPFTPSRYDGTAGSPSPTPSPTSLQPAGRSSSMVRERASTGSTWTSPTS